jgi:hypothetical protein
MGVDVHLGAAGDPQILECFEPLVVAQVVVAVEVGTERRSVPVVVVIFGPVVLVRQIVPAGFRLNGDGVDTVTVVGRIRDVQVEDFNRRTTEHVLIGGPTESWPIAAAQLLVVCQYTLFGHRQRKFGRANHHVEDCSLCATVRLVVDPLVTTIRCCVHFFSRSDQTAMDRPNYYSTNVIKKQCMICYTSHRMNDMIYDDLALEQNAKAKFGIDIDIDKVIVRQIPLSHTASATVYLTKKKQLYAFISAQSNLTFADVKKFVARMGLKPELYIPPVGRPNYFDEVGQTHFKAVFPGRTHITPTDLVYYRTLAPYNPALVQISEVLGGEIRQFDTDAHGNWRPAVKFAYRRIKTS